MRKIILNLAVSLDGFIEGPNGEYDWCFTDQDYGMHDLLNNIDVIFFGRKSYELLLAYDSNPYPEKQKYVFSRTLKTAGGNTQIIADDLKNKVTAIKNEPGKTIWLFGGADLAATFIRAGLLDELQLSIHPVLLGQGKPLFKDIAERKYLKLTGSQTYDTGLVQVFYDINR